MMRFDPTRKLIAGSAVALVIVSATAWIFWRVGLGVWQADFILGEIQSKIDGLSEERRRARALEEVLVSRKDDLARVNGFFVDRERPIAFIESMERAAARTQNSIAIDVDERTGEERTLSFRVTAEGDEANLLKYVRLLETLPYKIETEEVVFQRIAADSARLAGPRPAGRLLLSLRVRAR